MTLSQHGILARSGDVRARPMLKRRDGQPPARVAIGVSFDALVLEKPGFDRRKIRDREKHRQETAFDLDPHYRLQGIDTLARRDAPMRKAPEQKVATEQVLPALLRQNFSLFLPFAFREIAGNREFTPGWHLEAMEHQLNRLRDGDNRELIVTIPPRHLKSILISVAWVAWMLGREPHTRFWTSVM